MSLYGPSMTSIQSIHHMNIMIIFIDEYHRYDTTICCFMTITLVVGVDINYHVD
jgi:hypothetical protein